jgi:hypothetical protein
MGVLEAIGWRRKPDVVHEGVLVDEGTLATLRHQLDRATESLVDLQREDRGWESLTRQFANEVNRDGLTRNADLVRITSIMNPLLKRAKHTRASYVFGQGVQINARANTPDEGQDVDAVVQAYLDDEGNKAAVFGAQARTAIENDLFDDGNEFIAHFTNPLDGKIRCRPIPFDEIVEIITDPGDRFTPWFYKRTWVEVTPTETFGTDLTEQKTAYYPDLKYQPLTKLKTIGGHPINWDAPVYHIKVNPVGRDRLWGVGDGFAALPWARAYKEFLEDWALLMRALSRIAGIVRDKASKAQNMRAAAAQIQQGPAGALISTGTGEVEFPSKSGATLDSESGRPLAAMVAAAVGLPVTILLADPGVTGARATAETLDKPTRDEMESRQEVHAEFYRASTGYAIEQAVIAPRGPLKGSVVRDGDRLLVTLAGDTDDTVEVIFPDLEEVDIEKIMKAIEIADGTGKFPGLELVKLMLHAFRIRDIDTILEDITDDEGNLIDPGANAGNLAAKAFRDGKDPAEALK